MLWSVDISWLPFVLLVAVVDEAAAFKVKVEAEAEVEVEVESVEEEQTPLSDKERKARAEVAAARRKLETMKEKERLAQQREEDARASVLALILRIGEDEGLFAEQGTDAAQLAALATSRRESLESHFALLSSYLEGRIARRSSREEADSDETLALVADRTESDARQQAYLALLDELQIAQQDLSDSAEALFLLDAEIAESRAEEELAAAEREEARAASVGAIGELYDVEDELAETLARSPAAAPLLAEREALEREADLLADDAMDLQMELSELEEERDALVRALVAAGADADPALIGWLAALESHICVHEQELESLIRQTDVVHAEVALREQETLARLEAAGDPRAQGVALRVARAREKVAACVAAEVDAERAVEAAAAETDERTRLRAVALIAAEARAWRDRTVPLLEVLDGIDPRAPEEARRSGGLLAQPGVVNALSDGEHYFTQLVRAGADDEELLEIFETIPAPWRPGEYTEHRAWSATMQAWSADATAPIGDRLRALEAHVDSEGLVPEVTLPDSPQALAERLQAFQGVSDSEAARLSDFQIALECKARFRQAQDPEVDQGTRQAATRALLESCRAEPRSVIAWLAREGDPGARKLACAGLDDTKLQRAAPAIALRALLRRARQGEGQVETFGGWMADLQSWTDRVFARIAALVGGWGQALEKSTAPIESLPEGMIEGLQHAQARLSDKHTSLQELPTDDDTAAMLRALDDAREAFDGKLSAARAPLASNLRLIAQRRIDGAELGEALQAHLSLLQNLSTTA